MFLQTRNTELVITERDPFNCTLFIRRNFCSVADLSNRARLMLITAKHLRRRTRCSCYANAYPYTRDNRLNFGVMKL